MLSRPGRLTITALLLTTALTSCRGSDPSSVRFGYRWDDQGNVVIAYPICSWDRVSAANISIRIALGDKSTFQTLWSASGSDSDEVAQGVFTVGAPKSFRVEGKPLSRKLPEGFYVGVEESTLDGHPDSSRGDWIDQSVRPSSPLKSGKYMTSEGKIVSRQWVNDQLKCENAGQK